MSDQRPQHPPYAAAQPLQPQPAPRQPSPFAGTPVSDWVRDGAALVLLLLSLGLPWSLSFESGAWEGPMQLAAGRVEVVLITILSVLSLSIGYLARFGVFGGGVTLGGVLLARLLLNAPYALLVVVYIALDAFGVGGSAGVGLGSAAVFGLAGAFLAAQPREFEVAVPGQGAEVARIWRGIVLGVSVVVGVAAAVGVLRGGIPAILGVEYGAPAWYVIGAIVSPLVHGAALLVLFGSVWRRSEIARSLGLGLGGVVLAGLLIGAVGGYAFLGGLPVERMQSGGYVLLWLGAGAGLFASPGVRFAMVPVEPLHRWLRTASQGLLVIAVAAIVFMPPVVVGFFAGTPAGFLIGELLGLAIIAVGALIARVQLTSAPVAARTLVLSVLGGIVFLGLVMLSLAAAAWSTGYGFTALRAVDAFILFVGLPVLIALALTVPSSVRQLFAVARPADAVSYPGAAAPIAGGMPVASPALPASAPEPSAPAPADDPRARAWAELFDAGTAPERLAEIAGVHPEFAEQIAAHPRSYPALQAWAAALRGGA